MSSSILSKQVSNLTLFVVVGFGKCPEGGALRIVGASDSGVDEEHSTV